MKTIERPYIPEKGKVGIEYRMTFQPYPYDAETVDHLLTTIPKLLTPKFLSRDWKKRPRRHRLSGMCVVASQAVYYLLDTDRLVVKSAIDPFGDNHFWLEDEGSIIDPTADQYSGFDYSRGKKQHWYGYKGRIQVRSMLLMQKILRYDGKRIANCDLPVKFW